MMCGTQTLTELCLNSLVDRQIISITILDKIPYELYEKYKHKKSKKDNKK